MNRINLFDVYIFYYKVLLLFYKICMAIYKCWGSDWEKRILHEALTGKSLWPTLSEGSIREQAKVGNLVSLLTDMQKWDFLRVIEKLKLDPKVIIAIWTPEALIQFYREKVRDVEDILQIRPISEEELLLA